jgi:hypothetical protein
VPVEKLSPRSRFVTLVPETSPQTNSLSERPSSIVKQLYPDRLSLPRIAFETSVIEVSSSSKRRIRSKWPR